MVEERVLQLIKSIPEEKRNTIGQQYIQGKRNAIGQMYVKGQRNTKEKKGSGKRNATENHNRGKRNKIDQMFQFTSKERRCDWSKVHQRKEKHDWSKYVREKRNTIGQKYIGGKRNEIEERETWFGNHRVQTLTLLRIFEKSFAQ